MKTIKHSRFEAWTMNGTHWYARERRIGIGDDAPDCAKFNYLDHAVFSAREALRLVGYLAPAAGRTVHT